MRTSLTLSLAAATLLVAGGPAYAQSEARPEHAARPPAPKLSSVPPRGSAGWTPTPTACSTRPTARPRASQAFDRARHRQGWHDQLRRIRRGRDDARRQLADRTTATGAASAGATVVAVPEWRARADADKDGTVTQAEFTTAALARFDQADANQRRHHQPRRTPRRPPPTRRDRAAARPRATPAERRSGGKHTGDRSDCDPRPARRRRAEPAPAAGRLSRSPGIHRPPGGGCGESARGAARRRRPISSCSTS